METKDKIPAVCKPVVVNARNNLIAWLVVTGVVTFIFGGLAGMQLMQDRPKSEAVTGECADTDGEPGSAPFDRIQASVPVQTETTWGGFTLTMPNGLRIDLPKNEAGEMAYDVTAGYVIARTGESEDAHDVKAYFAIMRYVPESAEELGRQGNPILSFDIDYTGDGQFPSGADAEGARRVGTTRGGLPIWVMERENTDETTGAEVYNRYYVTDGESWLFASNRTTGEMNESERSETIRILGTIR
jgi:hypothetical protein